MAWIHSCTIACLGLVAVLGMAQSSMPPNQVSPLKDTRSLKPPDGAKVALIEFEDMECPYCARAFPIVHAAAKRYQLPLEECDFQLAYHPWSHQAAICAHYLKAKVSPVLAEEYRREVFASQARIASPDDLQNFTASFMGQHGQKLPFVMDPTGQFDREIAETTARGKAVGIPETPSIFVVTAERWIQVRDVALLEQAIQQAEAEVRGSAAAPGRHEPVRGKVRPPA